MRGKNEHLKEYHRYYIEQELKRKTSVKQMAQTLGFHISTIYREIKRGTFTRTNYDLTETKVYAFDVGQRVHTERMSARGSTRKLQADDSFCDQLRFWINKKYSPAAALYKISGKKLCLKSCYNYIHSGFIPGLNTYSLPYARIKNKKKTSPRKTMPKGTPIEMRPKFIDDRQVYGHWEMDTVYSSKDDKTCLLTLTERMSREELIYKIPNRTMQAVNDCIDKIENTLGSAAFRSKFKTITVDNGVEFSDYEYIQKDQRTQLYFAHPYSSWERGTNENHNRMIRRFIPKGDDIGLYTDEEIKEIENWINHYPRKMFGGLSSLEYREQLHLFP